MGSKVFNIIFTFILIILIKLPVHAQVITINTLIEDAKVYDQTTINLSGEVIGEVLERKDNAWININDGSNAIGIYLPLAWTTDLQYFGSYQATGDKVLIEGVFNRSCIDHGGEMDIHARSIKIIEVGSLSQHPISNWKFTMAFILLCVSLVFAFYHRPHFLQRKKHSKLSDTE